MTDFFCESVIIFDNFYNFRDLPQLSQFLYVLIPEPKSSPVSAVIWQRRIEQCREQADFSAAIALAESVFINFAKVSFLVQIFTRTVIMNLHPAFYPL